MKTACSYFKTAMSLALILNLTACIANKRLPARLYNVKNGEVVQAHFNFAGTTGGTINLIKNDGETFNGEYRTITGGSTTWGSVYTSYTTDGNLNSSTSTSSQHLTPNEYRGSAIAVSSKGTVIECEYITNTSRYVPRGQGVCKDNRGSVYKLMF